MLPLLLLLSLSLLLLLLLLVVVSLLLLLLKLSQGQYLASGVFAIYVPVHDLLKLPHVDRLQAFPKSSVCFMSTHT